jgi:hypothetical protein
MESLQLSACDVSRGKGYVENWWKGFIVAGLEFHIFV